MTKKVEVETAVLVVLVLTAGIVWRFYIRPVGGSAPGASSAVRNFKAMAVENPQIHWDRVSEAQKTAYETVGRDIFTGGLPPPPPPPVHTPQPGDNDYSPPPPPPPPPRPQLPLKYFGYGAVESGPGRRAFLTDGGAVYIVAEGDTVLGRYRVLKIGHSSLEFEELGSRRHGVTVIEDQGPPF